MKIKSFKTKSNDNTTCKVEVIYIESNKNNEEDAIIIQTKRIIPKSEFNDYEILNKRFPMFFAIKQTENYAFLITRSAAVKLSTFEKINDIVKEFINQQK